MPAAAMATVARRYFQTGWGRRDDERNVCLLVAKGRCGSRVTYRPCSGKAMHPAAVQGNWWICARPEAVRRVEIA